MHPLQCQQLAHLPIPTPSHATTQRRHRKVQPVHVHPLSLNFWAMRVVSPAVLERNLRVRLSDRIQEGAAYGLIALVLCQPKVSHSGELYTCTSACASPTDVEVASVKGLGAYGHYSFRRHRSNRQRQMDMIIDAVL